MGRTKRRIDAQAFVFALVWAIALVGFILVALRLPDGTAPTSQVSHSHT